MPCNMILELLHEVINEIHGPSDNMVSKGYCQQRVRQRLRTRLVSVQATPKCPTPDFGSFMYILTQTYDSPGLALIEV